MEVIKIYFTPFILAALISFALTPLMIKLAGIFGFIDIPKDDRRMHNKPMPLAGGLAIYISITALSFYFLNINKTLIALIIGSTIIVISGLIDDKVGLSPKLKIVFQLIASVILVLANIRIEFFTNPFVIESLVGLKYLAIPVTIFWICGITNTINLIDGLDGLAVGVSMICAISMLFLTNENNHTQVAILCALVAGSCLGFLPFNFNPAKIFMGDTGALYLGFMLSFITIEGVMKQAAILTIFIPVLVLGVPVFDTAFAMLRRKLEGKSIAEADKGHLHHRLLRKGLNQKQTVLILYTISATFGIIANFIAEYKSNEALIISLLMIVVIILVGVASGMLSNKEEK